MTHIQSFDALAMPASVCAVGTFDGVHLGHQRLLTSVAADARRLGVAAVAVTFFPHPKVVFGRAPALYLSLPAQKAELMRALGIDVVVTLPFDQTTIMTTADTFVDRMRTQFGMQSLFLGRDFALGHRRQGTAEYLSARGAADGFAVNIVEAVSAGGAPVSSTRIRESILRGDMADAALCLGRPHAVTGHQATPRRVRLDPSQVIPPAGEYPVYACGSLNAARILEGGEARLATESEDCQTITIEFI